MLGEDHSAQMTDSLLTAHLHRSGFQQPAHRPWTIVSSSISGRGVLATTHLLPGDLVMVDSPLVLAPRASPCCQPVCAACHRASLPLTACPRGCGLPLCPSCHSNYSPLHHQDCHTLLQWRGTPAAGGSWSPALLWVLAAVRCLRLGAADQEVVRCLLAHRGPHHALQLEILEKEMKGGPGPSKEEYEMMQWSCRVMDANAFETPRPPDEGDDEAPVPGSPGLRGLYPVAAMMNHACSPNTTHVFGKGHRMVVRAATEVLPGEELTNSYTTLLWGTLARRRHLLATKHFLCRCARCSDPHEWGAKLSALACCKAECTGCMLPVDPLQLLSPWQCDSCEAQMSGKQAAAVQAALARLLVKVDSGSPADIQQFLSDHASVVPACNQLAVQFKCELICLYGHSKGYSYAELSDSSLQQKEELCKEILQLLQTLRTGQCNMKGLVCYELACTLLEMNRRLSTSEDGRVTTHQSKEELSLEALDMLEQSALIFRGDATAPAGLWKLLDDARRRQLAVVPSIPAIDEQQ